MRQSELDRRTFVMGSFGFGMAVLGGGMLAGCVAAEEQVEENEAPAPDEEGGPAESVASEPEPAAHGGRALVAVFSYSGNTFSVAERIAEATGADLFRIETEQTYPGEHDALLEFAYNELAEGARPALAAQVEDLSRYDVVFLGYPNWNADLPMPLYTFLESVDLSGKTILPFTVHGGSGFSRTISTIQELQPGATVIEDGLSISRNSVTEAQSAVAEWVQGLDL